MEFSLNRIQLEWIDRITFTIRIKPLLNNKIIDPILIAMTNKSKVLIWDRIKPRYLLIFVWILFISIAKTFRWPNDWAEAHWLISYQQGFLRRALPGTLAYPILHFADIYWSLEAAIKTLSTIVYISYCILMLWIVFRIIEKSNFELPSVMIGLLFISSPYIVMSGHLNGYYDIIITIVTIFAFLLVRKGYILLSSILLSTGVLVHESIIIVGFPSVIFLALIQFISGVDNLQVPKIIIGFIKKYKILIILPIMVFIVLVISQSILLDQGGLRGRLIYYLSQFDFIKEHRNLIVPDAMTSSFYEHWLSEKVVFIDRITKPIHIIQIGFPLAVFLYYVWLTVKNYNERVLIYCSLLIITVLPLSLHMIAEDISRIWTYPLVVVFLGIWAIKEYKQPDEDPIGKQIIFPTIVVLIIAFFSKIPLMDGLQERFSLLTRILFFSPILLLFVYDFLVHRDKT